MMYGMLKICTDLILVSIHSSVFYFYNNLLSMHCLTAFLSEKSEVSGLIFSRIPFHITGPLWLIHVKLCKISTISPGWLTATLETVLKHFNRLRPRQNEQHFADDIFKCIFFNENVWISIKISLKFVAKGPINNIPPLGSDNGLVPFRRQAIIWTNDG